MEQHFRASSFREKLIERLFIGELLPLASQAGDCALEVAKPEVDNSGYDVALERTGIIRHVEFTASRRGARAASQNIHTALAAKPSGCVVCVEFDEQSLELGPFLFFGGGPGLRLPSIENLVVAKHPKANAAGVKAPRRAIRRVLKGLFQQVPDTPALMGILFGGTAGAPQP